MNKFKLNEKPKHYAFSILKLDEARKRRGA
ncbi:MAG: hypothetical protein K0S29_1366, partial [Gammaproteobacteria bacterium]|nr:hypothetical protein [Gammaproteobacteria bacterium]